MRTRVFTWLTLATFIHVFCAVRCEAKQIYVESGGQVVAEAEAFTRRTDVGSSSWVVRPTENSVVDTANGGPIVSNARGGEYLQSVPNEDGFFAVFFGPSVEYDFQVSTSGTYQLYLRWDGDGFRQPENDSLFADIVQLKDGDGGVIADHYQFSGRNSPNDPNNLLPDGDFATTPWDGFAGFEANDAAGTPRGPAFWDLSAGLHTLRLGVREDGAAVDAFSLQLAGLAAPIGIGPAVSVAVPEPSATFVGALIICRGLIRRTKPPLV